jgi:hypothetical protein
MVVLIFVMSGLIYYLYLFGASLVVRRWCGGNNHLGTDAGFALANVIVVATMPVRPFSSGRPPLRKPRPLARPANGPRRVGSSCASQIALY